VGVGNRIVGIDICGDPCAGEVSDFQPFLEKAKKLGLGITVHIAEVCTSLSYSGKYVYLRIIILQTTKNTSEENLDLLSYVPDRLGHATFLDETALSIVLERKTPIELCLSSNLLCAFRLALMYGFPHAHRLDRCKTVTNLETHHIHQYLRSNHPIAVCVRPLPPTSFFSSANHPPSSQRTDG